MRRLVIAVCLIAAGAATAAATPSQDLDRARDSFKAKDWGSAKLVLNDLLYPELQLVRQEEVVEAHVLLGACLFQLGNRERAVDEFTRALQIDPERSITTMRFSEGAVALFEDVKREQRARGERDAERKRLAEQAAAIKNYLATIKVYETHPYYVNFVPFGAGQFQNGHNGKGYFFAAGQGATFATSVGVFLYLAATYGLVAKVPLEDGPRVRRLQQVEIVSGAAFFGLYALGIFDSIRFYTPRQQVKTDRSVLPPELRDAAEPASPPARPARPAKKTSLRDRLRLTPLLAPGAAGIGLSWEND